MEVEEGVSEIGMGVLQFPSHGTNMRTSVWMKNLKKKEEDDDEEEEEEDDDDDDDDEYDSCIAEYDALVSPWSYGLIMCFNDCVVKHSSFSQGHIMYLTMKLLIKSTPQVQSLVIPFASASCLSAIDHDAVLFVRQCLRDAKVVFHPCTKKYSVAPPAAMTEKHLEGSDYRLFQMLEHDKELELFHATLKVLVNPTNPAEPLRILVTNEKMLWPRKLYRPSLERLTLIGSRSNFFDRNIDFKRFTSVYSEPPSFMVTLDALYVTKEISRFGFLSEDAQIDACMKGEFPFAVNVLLDAPTFTGLHFDLALQVPFESFCMVLSDRSLRFYALYIKGAFDKFSRKTSKEIMLEGYMTLCENAREAYVMYQLIPREDFCEKFKNAIDKRVTDQGLHMCLEASEWLIERNAEEKAERFLQDLVNESDPFYYRRFCGIDPSDDYIEEYQSNMIATLGRVEFNDDVDPAEELEHWYDAFKFDGLTDEICLLLMRKAPSIACCLDLIDVALALHRPMLIRCMLELVHSKKDALEEFHEVMDMFHERKLSHEYCEEFTLAVLSYFAMPKLTKEAILVMIHFKCAGVQNAYRRVLLQDHEFE